MKKTLIDFCTQVLTAFAYTIIVLCMFCSLFGDGAKALSSIFALGSRGLAVNTVFQFLGASVLTAGIRSVFTSDFIMKRMSYLLRNLCMLLLIFAAFVGFILLFGWFPAAQMGAWVLFVICYVVSFGLTFLISAIKISMENKRLEDALEQLKNRSEKEGE